MYVVCRQIQSVASQGKQAMGWNLDGCYDTLYTGTGALGKACFHDAVILNRFVRKQYSSKLMISVSNTNTTDDILIHATCRDIN